MILYLTIVLVHGFCLAAPLLACALDDLSIYLHVEMNGEVGICLLADDSVNRVLRKT